MRETRPPWQLSAARILVFIIKVIRVAGTEQNSECYRGALDSGSKPLTFSFTLSPSLWLILGV